MSLNAKKRPLKLLTASLLIYLCIPFLSLSQSRKPGSIEYLKLCNGYRGLELGSDIRQIPSSKLGYMDNDSRIGADSSYKYEYRDTSLLKMDKDLYLDLVGIRAHNDKIVNIYLFFKKSDGYKVLNTFLAAYGVFTSKPGDYVDIYDWHSSTVDVSLRYQLDNDLGMAIYTYNPQQEDQLQASRGKK